jgi:transposase
MIGLLPRASGTSVRLLATSSRDPARTLGRSERDSNVVQLATVTLDKVRRQVWQDLRQLPDQETARRFRGARWALLKNPTDLTDEQAPTLRKLKRQGGDLWRAYALKEALRAIFAGDLDEDEVAMTLDRFCSRASRSGLKPFVIAAQTIRKRKAGYSPRFASA